jgi:hypothetical protein
MSKGNTPTKEENANDSSGASVRFVASGVQENSSSGGGQILIGIVRASTKGINKL